MQLMIQFRDVWKRLTEALPSGVWPRPLLRCDAYSEEAWKLFVQTMVRNCPPGQEVVIDVLSNEQNTDIMAYRIGPKGWCTFWYEYCPKEDRYRQRFQIGILVKILMRRNDLARALIASHEFSHFMDLLSLGLPDVVPLERWDIYFATRASGLRILEPRPRRFGRIGWWLWKLRSEWKASGTPRRAHAVSFALRECNPCRRRHWVLLSLRRKCFWRLVTVASSTCAWLWLVLLLLSILFPFAYFSKWPPAVRSFFHAVFDCFQGKASQATSHQHRGIERDIPLRCLICGSHELK